MGVAISDFGFRISGFGMHLRGAAAAALLLAGCGLVGAFDPGGGAENRCTADTDCPGAVCDRPLAICVAPHAAPATVYLRLAYQTPASTLVREVRVAEAGGGSGPASFILPAPVAVGGVVRRPQPDGGGSRPVPAIVTFSMPSGIPGLPPEDVTVISAAEVTEDRTFSGYVVGGLHDVRIEPLGEDAHDLPPIAMVGLDIGATSPALLVDYGTHEPFRTVEGYVTRIDGQAAPNLSVRAEDPATGRRISSIGSTGPIATTLDGDPPGSPTPDTGFFRIVLPRDVDTFRLVIAPTQDATHFPTVVLGNLRFADLDTDGDGVVAFDSARDEQSSVALPPVGRLVLFQGRVEGREDPGFAPVPVPGATLRFVRTVETDLPDVTASFEQIAITDRDGSIVHAAANPAAGDGIWLPEGEYAVTIVAPAVGGYRSAHEPAVLVVAPPDEELPILRGRLFTLEPRAALNGEVVNLLGSGPAGSMPLEAILEQAAGGLRNADPANLNGVVRGRSDSNGGFGLLVEPGRHTLILRPPESSRFPWRIVRGVVAPGGLTRLALQAPVPLAGAVSAAGSGEPLPAVAVEAFYLPAGASAAIAVGRAQTDASGSFALLLPPRLDTI